MRDPEEEGLVFPLGPARALAGELDRIAGWLEQAATARTGAGADLTDFRGAYADRYRAMLDEHAATIGGVVERLRTAAGRLRGAIDEYLDLSQRVRTGA